MHSLDTTLVDIQEAVGLLTSERRDVKREYDNEIRKLQKAQLLLLSQRRVPTLVDVDTVLSPELKQRIENPTLL